VPVDVDPDYVANAGYPLSLFYANLRALPAKEVVVVLDACFSGRTPEGLLFKTVSPTLLYMKETAAHLDQGAVMSSAQGTQLSAWYPRQRHSLYTYYFLKGLQGKADANRDRRITVGELQDYVGEEVPYWAGREAGVTQQPKLVGRRDIVLATLRE